MNCDNLFWRTTPSDDYNQLQNKIVVDCFRTWNVMHTAYCKSVKYIPNHWIGLFTHSDWLLKLGIVFAILSWRGEGLILRAFLGNSRLFAVFWVNFCGYFVLLVMYILKNYSLECWWLPMASPALATSTSGKNW